MPEFADVAKAREKNLLRTSIVTPTAPHADEVTVRFLRFTSLGYVGYAKGACAGFLRPQAIELVRLGKAQIIDATTGEVIPVDLSEQAADYNEGRPMPPPPEGFFEAITSKVFGRGER